MNHQQAAFRRKITYFAIMCLLLFPLYRLGHPATDAVEGTGSPGGELARLRSDYDLAQANLGEIDPASETMKLATLGLRGVAANLLWTKANEYKMKKNWDRLSTTLNQIIKIQPNFMSVWEFQAHNLSYNVSVEFDDYQYRYHWVKKGMYFLISGIAYNQRDYKILTNLGLFFGLKIGRADERVQFRRMFRKDDDFHNTLSEFVEVDRIMGPGGPDNWLVAHEWYKSAENMVLTNPKVKVGGRSELMFFKDAPSQLRNYAADLEEEFEPDERARRAWAEALDAWREFGNRQIRTSIGTLIMLNDELRLEQRIRERQAELDELVPGVREQIKAEQLAELSAEEFAAYQKATLSPEEEAKLDSRNLTPSEWELEKNRLLNIKGRDLNFEENRLALEASLKIDVQDREIVDRVDEVAPENREAAQRKFLEIADLGNKLDWVRRYRDQINFGYWEARATAESTEDAIKARRALYDARELEDQLIYDEYIESDPITGLQVINKTTGKPNMLPGAKQKYIESFELWSKIYDEYPDLTDVATAAAMIDLIDEYWILLVKIDDPWPLDFPLQYLVDRYAQGQGKDIPTSDDPQLRARRELEGVPSDDDGDDAGDSSDTGEAQGDAGDQDTFRDPGDVNSAADN